MLRRLAWLASRLLLFEPAHRASGGRVVYPKMARSRGVQDLTPFPRPCPWQKPVVVLLSAWNRGPERVDRGKAIEVLAVLQVFGQQAATAKLLGGPDDQRIPPRKLVAIFDNPCPFEYVGVHGRRLPRLQVADVVPRGGLRQARAQAPRDHLVVFLQDLTAQPALAGPPQVRQPSMRHRLLLRFASVSCVYE